ncbi:unnamed protein product [Amoebophrya sp. A25]|nr:unnamed protein product [Amoebophrya sp. A25]|eukprot:GSA25T00001033001.1
MLLTECGRPRGPAQPHVSLFSADGARRGYFTQLEHSPTSEVESPTSGSPLSAATHRHQTPTPSPTVAGGGGLLLPPSTGAQNLAMSVVGGALANNASAASAVGVTRGSAGIGGGGGAFLSPQMQASPTSNGYPGFSSRVSASRGPVKNNVPHAPDRRTRGAMVYQSGLGSFYHRAHGHRKMVLGPKKGLAVHFGHENWNMVLHMMIGIRMAVGRSANEMNRGLQSLDFKMIDKFAILPNLANIMDSVAGENQNYTVFVDYAPFVFRKIRDLRGIQPEHYLRSVGPEQLLANMILGNLSSLSELSSEGKSGAFFYYTADANFMIKTVTKEEKDLLINMLLSYWLHMKRYPDSLIIKFFGLHALRVRKEDSYGHVREKKVYFVVMGNMFNTPCEIHMRYDLKGSTLGRRALDPALLQDELNENTRSHAEAGKHSNMQNKDLLQKLKQRQILDKNISDETGVGETTGRHGQVLELEVGPSHLRTGSRAASNTTKKALSSVAKSQQEQKKHMAVSETTEWDRTHARKDLDFLATKMQVPLPRHSYEVITTQLRKDAEFLASCNIIDYSVLLGVHNVAEEDRSDFWRSVELVSAQQQGASPAATNAAPDAENLATAGSSNPTPEDLVVAGNARTRTGAAPSPTVLLNGVPTNHGVSPLSTRTDFTSNYAQHTAHAPRHLQLQPLAQASLVGVGGPGSRPFSSAWSSTSRFDQRGRRMAHHEQHFGGIAGADRNNPKLFFIGVIDILTNYGYRKRVEHGVKSCLNPTQWRGVSCCPPHMYAERFASFMRDKVFVPTEDPSLALCVEEPDDIEEQPVISLPAIDIEAAPDESDS